MPSPEKHANNWNSNEYPEAVTEIVRLSNLNPVHERFVDAALKKMLTGDKEGATSLLKRKLDSDNLSEKLEEVIEYIETALELAKDDPSSIQPRTKPEPQQIAPIEEVTVPEQPEEEILPDDKEKTTDTETTVTIKNAKKSKEATPKVKKGKRSSKNTEASATIDDMKNSSEGAVPSEKKKQTDNESAELEKFADEAEDAFNENISEALKQHKIGRTQKDEEDTLKFLESPTTGLIEELEATLKNDFPNIKKFSEKKITDILAEDTTLTKEQRSLLGMLRHFKNHANELEKMKSELKKNNPNLLETILEKGQTVSWEGEQCVVELVKGNVVVLNDENGEKVYVEKIELLDEMRQIAEAREKEIEEATEKEESLEEIKARIAAIDKELEKIESQKTKIIQNVRARIEKEKTTKEKAEQEKEERALSTGEGEETPTDGLRNKASERAPSVAIGESDAFWTTVSNPQGMEIYLKEFVGNAGYIPKDDTVLGLFDSFFDHRNNAQDIQDRIYKQLAQEREGETQAERIKKFDNRLKELKMEMEADLREKLSKLPGAEKQIPLTE